MIQTAALSFFAGIVILHYSPQLPPNWLLIVGPVALVSTFFFKSRVARILLFVVIGFTWAQFQAFSLLKHRLPEQYIGKDITIIGHIASLPRSDERKIRFEFDIDEVLEPELTIAPTRVRLSWYQKREEKSSIELRAGDKWQFTVRLKPPRNFANPGSFNYSGWLLQKKILSVGYIRNRSEAILLSHDPLSYPVQRFRQSLRERLIATPVDSHFQPFLRALVIGDRSDMKTEDWAVLKNTGTVHLMAISGLHIGLIAGLVFFISRLIWSAFPFLTLHFAAPRAAAIMAWLSAFCYAALAGFSLPTTRALIMLSLVLLTLVVNKPIRPSVVLSLAVLLVLVFDSFAVLSVSFWLSFAAVSLIYYFIHIQQGGQPKLKKWLLLQIVISLGLLPLTILFFQQAPVVSPLANLIAVPIVGFIIIPLSFLGSFALLIHQGLGDAILSLTSSIFNSLWGLLEWFSQLPISTLNYSTPSWPVLLLACAGVLGLILPSVFKVRMLAIIFLLPLFFPYYESPSKEEIAFTILDVGQGLSAVIQTQNHVMVFDTGARFSHRFDAGRAIVIPFLNEKGVRKIDKLIISHGDNDHIGGTESIVSVIGVDTIVTSVPDKLPTVKSTSCARGQQWYWDDVRFEILHPDASDYASGLSENNLSCVLQVKTRNQTFLLTGDIEKEAEILLIERYQQELASDTLVAPHHGSKTSSSKEFISAISPDTIIIPAGWRNRYRFPHQSVLETYTAEKSLVLITAQQGAISIRSDQQEISTFRDQSGHYWDSQ